MDHEHDYIDKPGTEGAPYGPLVCKHCGISAEGDVTATIHQEPGTKNWVVRLWEEGTCSAILFAPSEEKARAMLKPHVPVTLITL